MADLAGPALGPEPCEKRASFGLLGVRRYTSE